MHLHRKPLRADSGYGARPNPGDQDHQRQHHIRLFEQSRLRAWCADGSLLALDPIVDITTKGVTLRNCIVRWGGGRGVYVHSPAKNVTLIGNQISDTKLEGVRVDSVGSDGGPAAVLQKNFVEHSRNPLQGSGDTAVRLINVTGGEEAACNVISTESNGIVSNSPTTFSSWCNAFYINGSTYGGGQSPIAELSNQGTGMISDRDCVVTVQDNQNTPALPTRCLKDPVTPQPGQVLWKASCESELLNTCTAFLQGKPAFNLPVGPFNHDEDGDGVVERVVRHESRFARC